MLNGMIGFICHEYSPKTKQFGIRFAESNTTYGINGKHLQRLHKSEFEKEPIDFQDTLKEEITIESSRRLHFLLGHPTSQKLTNSPVPDEISVTADNVSNATEMAFMTMVILQAVRCGIKKLQNGSYRRDSINLPQTLLIL